MIVPLRLPKSPAWAAAFALAVLHPLPAGADAAETEETMKLEGGADGTVFRSLTVTGEDRIRIEFDRPDLRLDLDPRSAPGLEWGDPMAILREPAVELVGPLLAGSAAAPEPLFPEPWIDRFRAGDVVRFRPELEGVAEWRLTVADSRSDTVAVFEGRGNPPGEVAWNGLSRDGTPVPSGVTCSYVLEATDRAGNHRSFVGQGFELPSYRVTGEDGSTGFLFPGAELANASGETPPVLREVAGRLGQVRPANAGVEVKVAAASFSEAEALAGRIAEFLGEYSLGDPARIRPLAEVRPDAPRGGTVAVVARP